MNINKRLINSKFIKPLIKVGLNLSVLFGLTFLIAYSYQLFTAQFVDPLRASILLILEFTLWLIIVILSRSKSRHYWLRYKGTKPNFKLTTLSVVAILLIFTFAGVHPLVDYKNVVTGEITNFINMQQVEAEERRVAEENRKATEKAEMDATGVVDEYDFYKDYIIMFNKFRSENGRQPLIFDVSLNELAAQRAIEISQPGNFSHEGIRKYNLGENIAMMAYSSDSASNLIELWANSPGHRSNMLLSSYHKTGFAKNGRYAVQIFD